MESAMEIDKTRIEDAIVSEVADKMVGDDDLYAMVKRGIDERVDRLWNETVKDRITAEVEAAIAKGFEHEYQKIDGFGIAKGPSTTIRAELEKLIAGYWNERVDRAGKPDASTYGNTTTRAEWLMAKMCADDFAGQMKQHVINVTGALKDGFRKELNSTVNKLLSDVFHVRSMDDQGKGREIIAPVAKPVGTA